MNNCKIVRKMFSEYIDGALPDAKARAVKEHIEQCGECREIFDSMNAIIAYMNDMEKVAPPSDFLEQVNLRLERRSPAAGFLRRVSRPTGFRLPLELAGLAAAVALIVYLFGFPGREGMEEMAPRDRIAGRTEETAVEAEAKQVEVRSGDVKNGSAKPAKPEKLPADDVDIAIALKDAEAGKSDDLQARGGRSGETPIGRVAAAPEDDGAVSNEVAQGDVGAGSTDFTAAKEKKESTEPAAGAEKILGAAYSAARSSPVAEKDAPIAGRGAEARQRAKGEEEAETISSLALSVNPPSDGFDSLLAAREGLGRELEALVARMGGRVVTASEAAAPEAAAPKISLARAQSDMRAIRPLTVVIPGDSLHVFLDEIARMGKMRPIDSSIVSQTEDSATVRVDFR